MNRLWFVAMLAVLVVAGGYYFYETNRPGSLVLRFVAFVEDESLVFHRVRYGNPGGAGEFEIRDFRFFLSNIKLVSGSEEYSVPESYGSPKVRVGHFARLSRGGCSSRLVQQSIIIPMTADAEWKPKARRMITRTLLCSPSTMPLVTPQRM